MRRWPLEPRRHLRALTEAAYHETESFRIAFELALYQRRPKMLQGSQTNIYCIAEDDGAAWKIGVARNPQERLATLQVGNPRPLLLYAWAPAPQALESYIHHVLRRERLTGEWFSGRRTLAVASAIDAIQEQGDDVFTMDAQELDLEDALYILTSRVEDIVHFGAAA